MLKVHVYVRVWMYKLVGPPSDKYVPATNIGTFGHIYYCPRSARTTTIAFSSRWNALLCTVEWFDRPLSFHARTSARQQSAAVGLARAQVFRKLYASSSVGFRRDTQQQKIRETRTSLKSRHIYTCSHRPTIYMHVYTQIKRTHCSLGYHRNHKIHTHTHTHSVVFI